MIRNKFTCQTKVNVTEESAMIKQELYSELKCLDYHQTRNMGFRVARLPQSGGMLDSRKRICCKPMVHARFCKGVKAVIFDELLQVSQLQ